MRRRLVVDELDEYGELNRDAVREALADVESVLNMIGGAVSIMAIRAEVDKDQFVNQAVVIQWESFAPAQRKPKDEVPDASEFPADPDRDVELAT